MVFRLKNPVCHVLESAQSFDSLQPAHREGTCHFGIRYSIARLCTYTTCIHVTWWVLYDVYIAEKGEALFYVLYRRSRTLPERQVWWHSTGTTVL